MTEKKTLLYGYLTSFVAVIAMQMAYASCRVKKMSSNPVAQRKIAQIKLFEMVCTSALANSMKAQFALDLDLRSLKRECRLAFKITVIFQNLHFNQQKKL